jgi:hypothetical protein
MDLVWWLLFVAVIELRACYLAGRLSAFALQCGRFMRDYRRFRVVGQHLFLHGDLLERRLDALVRHIAEGNMGSTICRGDGAARRQPEGPRDGGGLVLGALSRHRRPGRGIRIQTLTYPHNYYRYINE